MRRWLVILVAIGFVAAASAQARRPSWGRPVAIAHETYDVYEPYFRRSPDHSQVVVAEPPFDVSRGVKLSARRRDGSWEPIVFPAVRPAVELPWSVDVNDHGTIAVTWPTPAPNPPSENDYVFCWCRGQGAVRTRHGVFGPVHTFTPASADQWPPLVYVNPDDTTTALWPPSNRGTVWTADADAAGRFSRTRVVARDTRDWEVARTHGGRPFVEVLIGHHWYGATHPFDHPHRIPAPGYGSAFASDLHGHEVLASWDGTDITVAYRRVGGSLGPPHVVAHTGDGGECDPNVAMNRHQRVFVAWTCGFVNYRRDYAQGAVVAPGGRVASLSRRYPAEADNYPALGIDLDDHGRGVAAWDAANQRDISSLVVTGGRLVGFRHVSRLPRGASGTTADATVDSHGRGLATWGYNSQARGSSEIEVASIDLRERR